jgi:ABC-type multidrug transport system fused ATPase/permease subunit
VAALDAMAGNSDSSASYAAPRGAAKSQVQFHSFMNYAEEEDDKDNSGGNQAAFYIVRSGALDTECSVDWYTDPNSKCAGTKFKEIKLGEQTVVFKPNECYQKVYLDILANKTYDNVIEVMVHLGNPVNCEISNMDMDHSRIKIIDYDVFPTDKFENEILADRTAKTWKQGKDFAMLIELAKLFYSHNKTGAMKVALADLMENIIFIVQMELGRRIVGHLAKNRDPGQDLDRTSMFFLLRIASFLIFLNGFMHASAYFRNTWKVGGAARKTILLALMERFLYFEESSRSRIETSQFRLTFAEESFHLVSNGYMNVFKLVKAMSRVVLIALYFQLLGVLRYFESAEESEDGHGETGLFFTLIPIAVVPVILAVWVNVRLTKSDACREETVASKVNLMNHMTNCVDNYALIAANAGRPMAIGQCSDKVAMLNKCIVQQSLRAANDVAMFGWLAAIIESVVVVLGGVAVLTGHMDLGTFTALLRGIKGCMGQYRAVYTTFMDMQSTYPGLWHTIFFTNYKTDLRERFTKQELDNKLFENAINAQKEDGKFINDNPLGNLNIEFNDVRFKYSFDEVIDFEDTEQGLDFLGLVVNPTRADENGVCTALEIVDVKDGLIKDEYNAKNRARKVKVGDFITGANGRANSAADIKEQLSNPGPLSMAIERAAMERPLSIGSAEPLPIHCGKLIAITGPSSCGVRTVLQMISGMLLPDPASTEIKNQLFLPPHLRILYVSYKEQLWTGPIGESVFIGKLTESSKNVHLHELNEKQPEEVARGLEICRQLNIPAETIKAIEDSLDDTSKEVVENPVARARARNDSIKAITSLSSTTICKMQLAAALIDDPEVLVINKAFCRFSLHEQDNVMRMLRTYVAERGVERDPATYHQRTPRTCVFSSTTPIFLSCADEVYEFTSKGELHNVTEGFHEQEQDAINKIQISVRDRKKTIVDQLERKITGAKLNGATSTSPPEDYLNDAEPEPASPAESRSFPVTLEEDVGVSGVVKI